MPRSSLLNVPYEGYQQVSPEAPPNVQQNIHVDADMFGAQKGAALEGLGHAIGKLGDVFSQIGQKNDEEQADTELRRIDTEIMKKNTQLQEDFRMKDPADAASGFDDYDKQARKIADDAVASASNPRVRKLIGPHAENRYRDTWKFGFGVKTDGVRKYADQVSDARIDQAVQSAAVANSEDALNNPKTGVISIINGETVSKGIRNGWSPEVVNQEAFKKKSSAYGMFIGNMAHDNPVMAQRYFDKYSDQMTNADRTVLQGKIEARTRVITGPDAGKSIIDGTPPTSVPRRPLPPPATITEPPKGPNDPRAKQKKSEVEGGPQLAEGETLDLAAQTKLTPHNRQDVPIPGYASDATTASVENYIADQAKLRGIDPGTALAVYKSEGSSQWKSTVPGENSWGPFQLYTGGGLGNEFQKDTGLDPSDPKTWKENIEYALNKVVEKGWGSWNGAKAVGITGRQGVVEGAQTVPVGESGKYSKVKEDLDEEPAPKTPLEGRTIKAYVAGAEKGDPDAKASKEAPHVIEAQNIPGRIRALPPDPRLKSALEAAGANTGVTVRITSGGQSPDHDPGMKDRPGGWTGSLRHDGGRAVDADLLGPDGKVLGRNDPRRIAFLEEVSKQGAGGIGAGYMSDPLKVHIGITGGSGQVGRGLGAYAGNSEERAAVTRGLVAGGHDASTRFAASGDGGYSSNYGGGRVRLASLSTGTMSDAPQIGSGTQYAQAGVTSDATPGSNRAPITAETPVSELNQRIDEERSRLNALGYGKETTDAMENEARRLYQKMGQEKADDNKRATDLIGGEIYGDALKGRPPAENLENIKKDPAMTAAWEALTPGQRKSYEAENLRLNSTNAKRTPNEDDNKKYDNLLNMSITNPDEFSAINPFNQGLPNSLAAKLKSQQDHLMKQGVVADPATQITNKVLKLPNVLHQLGQAGIVVDKQHEVPIELASAIKAEVAIHIETHNGKPPDSEESNKIVNGVLREVSKTTAPLSIFGFNVPLTGGTTKQRAYQVPLSKDEQDVMVKEYRNKNPGLIIKDASDIPPWEQKTWQANRRLNTKE